jgi:NAD-dependent dihydropyrimidine dehydrogenase PreA subunit
METPGKWRRGRAREITERGGDGQGAGATLRFTHLAPKLRARSREPVPVGEPSTVRLAEEPMTFVIAEPCIGVKDKSCVEVCPVNCIYEGEDMYYIHPDECIDCQACEAACPVQAIFPDNGVPEKWASFIEKNRTFFENK